jgi:small-conductance mechanosensitive channel
VTICLGGGRAFLVAALLAVVAAPARSAQAVQDPATQEIEAEASRAAPVLLGGEAIIWITTGAGAYTPHYRAERITQRLLEIVADRSLRTVPVTVVDVEGASELRVGPRLLMVITPQDARRLGVARASLAQQYAGDFDTAIRAERLRYLPATLIRSSIYGALATLALVAIIWLIRRLARSLRNALERWQTRKAGALRVQQAEIVSAVGVRRGIEHGVRAVRVVLILIVLQLYLTYVLGLFPWTRAVSIRLLDYILTPVRTTGSALIGYLPNLLFVVVITAVIYAAIRLVRLFFDQIGQGRIVFARFPAEWADPTNKIIRLLLVAFGVVVVFPYLPASNSPAFTGVSVLMGLLISLASSSALSNMIAGVVLTYTGAFRLGDRVRVGDTFGDVIETSLLATRVRTIKNEDVTIPNGLVLNTSVVNYSREANSLGLILHTSVTIGYDAPWRKIHALLIEAALDTPGVQQTPPPFVWQTALNDFYVTYEINAYTSDPQHVPDMYAALHARIQDTFYTAGVEIMSPHYTSLRDGNAAAIPDTYKGSADSAPAFRVLSMPSNQVSPATHPG